MHTVRCVSIVISFRAHTLLCVYRECISSRGILGGKVAQPCSGGQNCFFLVVFYLLCMNLITVSVVDNIFTTTLPLYKGAVKVSHYDLQLKYLMGVSGHPHIGGGCQWLRGRVSALWPKGPGFNPRM